MRAVLQLGMLALPVVILAFGWQFRPNPTESRPAGALGNPQDSGAPNEVARRFHNRPMAVVLTAAFGLLILGRVVGLVPALGIGGLIFGMRRSRPRRQRRIQRAKLLQELPEVVDFYRVAFGGGLTPLAATEVVARRLDGLIPAALAHRLERVALGALLADELASLPSEVGEEVRGLSRVLVSTERHGVPAAAALEQLATDARLGRRRAAEINARRLPVKLLFPLVVCTLPAFVLLTVVPIAVTSFQSLSVP